jgi:hypothetical protein
VLPFEIIICDVGFYGWLKKFTKSWVNKMFIYTQIRGHLCDRGVVQVDIKVTSIKSSVIVVNGQL